MDMISPEGYRDLHANDSWEELAKERARLVRSLRRYELHHDDQNEQEMCPSASLVYQFELEFLRELCDLTRIAMCRETEEVDCFGVGDPDAEEEDDEEDAPESISRERVEEVNSQGFNIIDSQGNTKYCEGC